MIQQGIESSIHATSVYVGLLYSVRDMREAAKKRVDGCIRRLATVKDEALKFFAVIKQICAYQSDTSRLGDVKVCGEKRICQMDTAAAGQEGKERRQSTDKAVLLHCE
ncbi:hypothetical protein OUZ56_021852 [Daphnia magna]|uniref:Uncharacterized protein n=1 Tax=Daphnia magna TaxID=35525 RepID=A0ABR0AUM7_9CRUS|nr:hypothetical protein OUZ56_021852 [Daphnia magna]